MWSLLLAFLGGAIFALGLVLSQMADPAKVLNFLDVAGHWDPSLMLVMGGALALTVPGFRLILKQPHPLLDGRFHLPQSAEIDADLVWGSILFGIGWGLVGLCPGPAIVGLVSGAQPIFGFMLTMLIGYRLMDYLQIRRGKA